jgi:hypothetical protein
MRLLFIATVVLIFHSIPQSVHPDMAGWLLLLAVGVFMAFLDMQDAMNKRITSMSKVMDLSGMFRRHGSGPDKEQKTPGTYDQTR